MIPLFTSAPSREGGEQRGSDELPLDYAWLKIMAEREGNRTPGQREPPQPRQIRSCCLTNGDLSAC